MSEQRQDWAALRVACDNTLAGRSVDSHIDPRFVLDLLAEVDRLTEALEAAERDYESRLDHAHRHGLLLTKRAERAEADLAACRAELEQGNTITDALDSGNEHLIGRVVQLQADLADEKRRHAELRARVEALADEWAISDYTTRSVDGERLRRALLDTATEEGP